jgi:demethylmenaquinone methyltransferase/2-methoxy-6-polyprenyl-1,4-benzoquinol methylase
MRARKDPVAIREMFGSIAKRYDLANSILSFQLHQRWNRRLIRLLEAKNTLLDLCAGTGKIAFGWLKLQKCSKKVILLDLCQEMLDVAACQAEPYTAQGHDIQYMQADAASIPLPSSSVDAISMAYGIRNVQDPPAAFREAYRVLNPGGKLAILELTEPSSKWIRSLHRIYLSHVLPFLGGLITGQKEAYQYLARSIPAFSKPEAIKDQLLGSGFHSIDIHPLACGIATLISATK